MAITTGSVAAAVFVIVAVLVGVSICIDKPFPACRFWTAALLYMVNVLYNFVKVVQSVEKVLITSWPLAQVPNTFQKVNVLEVYYHRSTLSSNCARQAGHMAKKI